MLFNMRSRLLAATLFATVFASLIIATPQSDGYHPAVPVKSGKGASSSSSSTGNGSGYGSGFSYGSGSGSSSSSSVSKGGQSNNDQGSGYAPSSPGSGSGKHVKVIPAHDAEKIVRDFAKIEATVVALAQAQAQANPQGPPNFQVAEKGLVTLSKTCDKTNKKLIQVKGFLDAQSTVSVAQSINVTASVVVKITVAVAQAKALSDKQGYSHAIVTILQGLASQFAVLQLNFKDNLDVKVSASLEILNNLQLIICSIDRAADALEANTKIAGEEVCSGGKGSSSAPPPAGQPPSMPKYNYPPGFDQCSQSSTSYMKFAYDNNCLTNPQSCASKQWCPKGFKHPTSSWTPPKYFCSGH